MSKALVISLNFHPGHVSHMLASYKQFEELGYNAEYYIAEGFVNYLPENSRFSVYGKSEVPEASVALFLFPSQKNLSLIRKLKHQGSKVLYIFHEPLAPLSEYRKAGFSYAYLAKLWVINRVSSLTVRWSDAVLLPSRKAVELYKANHLYKNDNCHYLPLMYADECTEALARMPRLFFGYIGTVAADHSFYEFLRFVEKAVLEEKLPELDFLIATKSEFEIPQALLDSCRVTVCKGTPLSDEDINSYYASTYVVWNAYARTTQSGVLAKSFMFGTPAVVLKKNLSEYTEDGQDVVAIESNTSFEEIENAVYKILGKFDHFSEAARKRFEDTFYYRRYNEKMREILSSISDR